jgi:hypothetical protein
MIGYPSAGRRRLGDCTYERQPERTLMCSCSIKTTTEDAIENKGKRHTRWGNGSPERVDLSMIDLI